MRKNKKTYCIKRVRGFNHPKGYSEVEFKGSLETLIQTFHNFLELGVEFDKTISLNPSNIKSLVSGLNKTCYENRDYFTEYSIL